MDLLRHLELFLAVVDEGSFSAAAERLGMSQPPLSQRIKTLEQHLGVEVFDRSRRRIDLTPAGSLLVPEARELVSRARDLPTMLTPRPGEQVAMRVDLPDTFAAPLLAAVASRLAAASGSRVLPRALPPGQRVEADDQHPVLEPGPGAPQLELPLGLALHPGHPVLHGGAVPHPSDFADAQVLLLAEDDWQLPGLGDHLAGLGVGPRAVVSGCDAKGAVAQVCIEDAACLTDAVHAHHNGLVWQPVPGIRRVWHATGALPDRLADAVTAAVRATGTAAGVGPSVRTAKQ